MWKKLLLGLIVYFFLADVQFYAKTFNLRLSSSVWPAPGWRIDTNLWPFCTLAFAGFHLPFLSFKPMPQLSFAKRNNANSTPPSFCFFLLFFALSIKKLALKNLNNQCTGETPGHVRQHTCTYSPAGHRKSPEHYVSQSENRCSIETCHPHNGLSNLIKE